MKFIYSEKATKFCEIFTLLLSYVAPVKSRANISRNFLAFLEYMIFIFAFTRDLRNIGPSHLFKLWAIGWWIMWFISRWEENNCCQNWANSQNYNSFSLKTVKCFHFVVNLLSFDYSLKLNTWTMDWVIPT